jgi:hypothetical protein
MVNSGDLGKVSREKPFHKRGFTGLKELPKD